MLNALKCYTEKYKQYIQYSSIQDGSLIYTVKVKAIYTIFIYTGCKVNIHGKSKKQYIYNIHLYRMEV